MHNSEWFKWSERKSIPFKNEPGVYFIAYTALNINRQPFDIIEDIVYVGVTISKKGIDNRLNQFSTSNLPLSNSHGIHFLELSI
ncbi:MAG: hypothetical protein WC716_04440 [Chitinophagaceae bacterium]|jgi:hypothetical protein